MLQQQPSQNSGLGLSPNYGGNGGVAGDSQGALEDLDKQLLQGPNSFGMSSPQSQAPSKAALQNSPGASGQVEFAEIDMELFNRLLKVGVIRASPNIKSVYDRKIVGLDEVQTMKWINGVLLGNYLVVLKDVLHRQNQDFAISAQLAQQLKDQVTTQARLFNWNLLCNELDKIGIIIEPDVKTLYVAGDVDEIGRLFQRIERYMKRISGDEDILSFNDYRRDDRLGSQMAGGPTGRDGLNASGGRRGFQSSQKKAVKDGVDIMQMDVTREPSDTESTLEFILNTLCRALNMKPKQSAALLTNNNQFLTHCVVKGVKGRFEPMVNWYQDIYQYSKHLSMMLEAEVENAVQTRDARQIKAANQNFEKVMQTISCGCYSHALDVAQLCIKSLSCIAQDFSGNIELVQLRNKFFQSKDQGLFTINYAFRKHPELAEEFVTALGNFTGGGEQMAWVYLNQLQTYYPDQVDYFNFLNTILPYLTIKYQEDLTKGNLLSQLIEKCVRFADSDPANTPQVRIAALSLLTEIWLNFSEYIEKQNEFSHPIQHVYKKNSRERIRSLKVVTAVSMFKLLDKFSAEKNASAPAIYKSLIFSLVESPWDQTVRELYLTNFQYLFEKQKSVPVGLLVDPFVKAYQLQDNFQFETFDYDFFAFLSQHPKLNITNSIQMLDLLAKIYLNDLCNASAASVPFMMICSRFLGTLQCQEFIMKFITISLNQLLLLDGGNEEKTTPSQHGRGKVLALPAPGGGSTGPGKQRDFRISSSKKTTTKRPEPQAPAPSQEDEVNTRLKRSLIIIILLKIQNLRQDDVNNAMRDMVLGAQKQYKDQNNGYLSNGLMAVLKYWGDPDLMFNQYLKRLEKIESEEKRAYERLQRQEQVERRMLGYESDEKPQSVGGGHQGLGNVKSVKSLKGVGNGRNSMALMPITENQQNLRALQEIEMIKKIKKDREANEKVRQDQMARKKSMADKKLREELLKRRVEIGVATNLGGIKQEIKALIFKEDEVPPQMRKKFKNPMDQQLQLIDLSQEEDRDQEIVASFMKKYAKIWKFLFGRYANQAYSSKGTTDFDALGKKTSQISLPEITKILRDHNTYPTLINKEEVASLIRLINMQSAQDNSRDISMLDYAQFLSFIPQLAFLAFSRPPMDKSNFPPIESLNALIAQFEQATRDRGKSTQLYEDPDQSGFADKELLVALDAKINQDPSYPLPEGFRKQIEKVPVYSYKVPDCAQALLREGQVVATETMDGLLFDALGIHFLEPQVSFDVKYKVKPAIAKAKKPAAEALGYMKKIEKRGQDATSKTPTAYAAMSAADKRKEGFEVKPKINLALKLQVTKQDLKSRPHYQEVAEVFEEVLQAAEKGLLTLPPRLNRAPGQVQNEARLRRAQEEQEEMDTQQRKEGKRRARDEHVKKVIKDTHYGGRELPINEYHKLKAKTEAKERERMDKEERNDFQDQVKQQRDRVGTTKAASMQDVGKKKQEEHAKAETEARMAEKIRREFLAKQRKQIRGGFQETYKKRDDIIIKQEEKQQLAKENEAQLKDQMARYIKDSKQDRNLEKQERQDVETFLAQPDVKQLFDTYNKQLQLMYKFYAAQDSRKDGGFDLEYLHSTVSFQEFVRFGYQQNICPNFLPPDDVVFIYKNLVREQQDVAALRTDKASVNHRTSGMIDYDAFKKALVRVAVLAQEQLGGADQDLLAAKLAAEQKTNAAKRSKTNAIQRKMSKAEEQKKKEMEKLRQQFEEEQRQKQDVLSKQAKGAKDKAGGKEKPLFEQKREEEREYQLDQAKLDQEEAFFKKWLKQRENLGPSKAGVVGDTLPSAALTDNKARAVQKKDLKQKELDDLNSQVQQQQNLKKMKFEQTQVRKQLDVSIISHNTIAALFAYLDLNEEDSEWDVNKKLNNTMARKQTVGRQSRKGNDLQSNLDDQTEDNFTSNYR